MFRYEVMTPISNGRDRHQVGTVLTFDTEAEAADLVGLGALRPVAGEDVETDGAPIGTAQRVAAAGSQQDDGGLRATIAAMRKQLEGQSHKALDKLIADEQVPAFPFAGAKATVREKAAAIAGGRTGKMLAALNRDGLIALAAADGYADLAALELAEDAEDDLIRATLMRVAAAQAD